MKLKKASGDFSNNSIDNSNVHTESYHPSQEHEIRVKKIEELKSLDIEPWPQVKFVSDNTKKILEEYKSDEEEKEYSIAGRILNLRWHGRAAFSNIQDSYGKIQLYFREDIIGHDKFEFLKKFIDIGDIIWISGTSFKTKTGEITLKVKDFSLLSKCLHPLPDKFYGLEDIEIRYRQRYLDLISNQDSALKFKKRSKIISFIRKYLEDFGFLEVETPMLHPIPGGAIARPFTTHHNALDTDFYLRIAPELYLKRLVVGGFERVFEINRNFRNEGISTRHNPEFTMLEFYTAYRDYHWVMDFVEKLLQALVQKICDSLKVPFGDHIIDFSKFERISIKDAVLKYGNLKEINLLPENIDKVIREKNIKIEKTNPSVNEKIYVLFEHLAESKLIQPTFVTHFPIEISPLAKRDPDNPNFATRFELYIGTMEISNAFNELNDPFDQAQRFKDQLKARQEGDQEAHFYDADYVLALEYGLPPTVGVGMGIDRITMLLTNTTSIKDVILFPTLKKR